MTVKAVEQDGKVLATDKGSTAVKPAGKRSVLHAVPDAGACNTSQRLLSSGIWLMWASS